MIKINGDIVTINKFPDGTPRINIDVNSIEEYDYDGSPCIWLDWIYESNDEMFYLMLIKKHLERFKTNVNYYLNLPYIPNARMDRVKNNDEVFTLRYFCEFINGLKFSGVYVLDAHSDVSTALLNNCFEENPKKYIEQAIAKIGERNLVLYFPDAGAAKRYSDLFPELQYVFEPKSAAFIAVLSSYPTTHDIINASRLEVFNVVYEATKHRYSMDKIDKLFDLCHDTLVPDNISSYGRSIILDIVENIKNIKGSLKSSLEFFFLSINIH